MTRCVRDLLSGANGPVGDAIDVSRLVDEIVVGLSEPDRFGRHRVSGCRDRYWRTTALTVELAPAPTDADRRPLSYRP